LHAALIDNLSAAGAASIAYDVNILEPRTPAADPR
jgi:CHASE2 domain-containing sensor protein